MIRLTIPGEPVAQGRPKAAMIAGRVRVYDPKKSRSWKALIQEYAMVAGITPLSGPVSMELSCFFTLPKSKWKKRTPIRECPKVSKPDCSNLLKGVEDALNGIAYLDDSQIVMVTVNKLHAAQGEAPRTEITIAQLCSDSDLAGVETVPE